jgi:hypothetical protein
MSADALDVEATVAQAIACAVPCARRAASPDAQWSLEVQDTDVVVRIERPLDRELAFACGAALLDLRVALEHEGLDIVVSELPDPHDPLLLARVRVRGIGTPPPDDLFEAIPHRQARGGSFAPLAVAPSSVAALEEAAAAEGARLHVVDEVPLRAVLATAGDGPMAWLAAGQALERARLTAAREGLHAALTDRPTAQLEPPGVGQVALRIGHPTHPREF